jgi:Peptidase A4 family
MRKTYTLIAALTGVLLLAGGAGASASTGRPTLRAITVYPQEPEVGYGAAPKALHATAFQYITASWSVVALDTCKGEYFANEDVSLGPVSSGINEHCSAADVTPTYDAQYYWNGTDHQEFVVNPGDAITASIFYTASTKKYTVKLSDLNTGQGFSLSLACAAGGTCVNSQAFVGMDGGSDFLGPFGQAHFDAIKITDNVGQAGGLLNPNWVTTQSNLTVDQGGNIPGPIYSGTSPAESAFSITACSICI